MDKRIIGVIGFSIITLVGNIALGSSPYECDDRLGMCGTPDQSGGGGCGCGCGGSILVANTDDGDTYQSADDYDNDGREDPYDNCWSVANKDQSDNDGDRLGNVCDNCPSTSNKEQEDIDGDRIGDVCDKDIDGDGVENKLDNCYENPNPSQSDIDNDGLGDACDSDADGDGLSNLEDECPLAKEIDSPLCDIDNDGDDVPDLRDNCPLVANDQRDIDSDGLGDVCDEDMDGDGVINKEDNCIEVANEDQSDLDRDRIGDDCDEEFCWVVEGDLDNCLNPDGLFEVYSPNMEIGVGEEVRLRLFANRVNVAIRYSWEVVKGEEDWVLMNPTGAANISSPIEYHYMKDRVVTFKANKAGEYLIHLVGEQVWEDEITNQRGNRAEFYTTIKVEGEDLNTNGCSIVSPGQVKEVSFLSILADLLF
jgi:hypothetical protein